MRFALRSRHASASARRSFTRVSLNAIAYILSLVGAGAERTHIEAVFVTDDRQVGTRLQQSWQDIGIPVPLVVLESPNRTPAPALLQYIAFVRSDAHLRTIVTVALPETVPTRWWHPLVRNYFASGLKLALLSRPGVTVLSVPLAVPD